MGKLSRARMIWDDIRVLVVADVAALIDRRAEPLKNALDDTAPKIHKHVVADVTGLPALMNAANARVTALETDVALLKQRAGL